jgi:hypothetical protein
MTGARERLGRRGAAALVVAAWAAGAAVFFREQIGSGFRLLMGNDGDARLEVYLCEHWFKVLHGQASWLDPRFFWPLKGLLGWSDTFFVYQVFYAPLREVGADPFLAMQLTVIALSLVGFASFYALCRSAFAAPRWVALAMAAVFCFSNALYWHAGSYQLNGIYLAPLAALAGVSSWRAASSGQTTRAVVLGFSAGALAILLLFSTYYMGYFSLVAVVVLALVCLFGWRRRFLSAALAGIRERWPAVVAAAVGFAAGLGPFLATYLPTQRIRPPDAYAIALAYGGGPRALLDIGGGNPIWTSALQTLTGTRPGGFEQTYAPTPTLWLLGLGGGICCAILLSRGRALRRPAARCAVALALTAAVEAVLPLHLGSYSLWAVVHHLPGASAMRAIGRAQIVTAALLTLAAAAALTEIFAQLLPGGRRGPVPAARWALAALVLLAVAEQYNTTDASQLSRPAQLAFLASVRSAPAGCRSFYVVDPSDPTQPFYESQVDAMLVAQKLGLPTLNGYTAYSPPGWALERIGEPGYEEAALIWADSHSVARGLCRLDLGTMRWSPAPAG